MSRRLPYDFVVMVPPRCGSAWIANFLSYGRESCCYCEAESHEILGDPVPDFGGTRYHGNADAIYLVSPERIPEASKVAFVSRSAHAIRVSAARAGLNMVAGFTDRMMANVETVKPDMLVSYDDIFRNGPVKSEEACRKLWHYLLPELEWSNEHWKRVSALHVNHASTKQ